MDRLRVLLITKLFPNAVHPDEAPFNRCQFAALSRTCDVSVLATIPWCPGAARFSKFPTGEGVPRDEVIHGLPVRHPRVLYVPRIAPTLNGPLYAASLMPELLRSDVRPDVIVGSFAYPDGWAAVYLARWLGVPAVVKVHGSDIDVLSRQRRERERLCWGLGRAARVVAVSGKLVAGVEALGVPRERIDVILNGVDREIFQPRDRARARQELGRDPHRRLALFVGHYKRDKGVLDLIEAFEDVARQHGDLDLVLVGSGAEKRACEEAVVRLDGRLTVLGPRTQREVAAWMAACDVVVLPSRHEGTPNVLIEALACGRRVVATRVGGIPAVVHDAELGELVRPGERAELVAALARGAYAPYEPARVAALSAWPDWDESARRLRDVLERAVHGRVGRVSRGGGGAVAEVRCG